MHFAFLLSLILIFLQNTKKIEEKIRSMRQFLLLACNVLMLLDQVYGFTDETDRQALFEFKSQISEDKKVVLSSWNQSFPLCNWKGVTCGRKHKRVTRLDLGGLKLGGVISPSIGNISFLISLNLTDNSFGGIIPEEVGNLFRLEYLYMDSNVLGGRIPTGFSNCSRLLELYLFLNNLEGDVPWELGSLTKLIALDVSRNKLKGKLPSSLGNLTSIMLFSCNYNGMEGGIPDDFARLTQIQTLGLAVNNFSGVFPPAIYNLSSLESLFLVGNQFSGNLRNDFGILLPKLRELSLGTNRFTGSIPTTLSNISTLEKLGLNDNNLTGSIPPTFGKVRNLQYLALGANSLGTYSSGDLEFLDALTNCTQLDDLQIYRNRLGGVLPSSVTNLSKSLFRFEIAENLISGSIPQDIGNLISLQTFGFHRNLLTGPLPNSIGKIVGLVVLSVFSNRLSGEVPSSISNITGLLKLYLHNNRFQGTIPLSISNCRRLLHLTFGQNKFNGTIPHEIMEIQSLLFLIMSNNSFTGSIPEDIGRLDHLSKLYFGDNKLSGQLPQGLGKCLSIEELYLQGNSFDGNIPDISGMVDVQKLDISNNNLSGSIPAYLANFSKLQYLNLSFNNFEGRLPEEGIFKNATVFSVFGNPNLCGGIRELQLKPCSAQAPPVHTKSSSRLKRVVIGVSLGVALLLLLFIAFFYLRWVRKREKNQLSNHSTPSALEVFHEKISYGDLRNATDGFSLSNLIGAGSFGTVYKAFLSAHNKVVAVKVLNLQRHGAMKSFMAECESLKDIRHRNLVKLLTACSSIDFQGNDFRALIYEFMPNGSLDLWLHPEEVEENRRPSRTLTLLERLNIAIDVASVLEYLHVHCHEPIAHCDLKPSNILLDDDLTAHVSDFGLARILLKLDKESFLNQLSSAGVRGTVGYAAPEYGMGGKPSTHGDVYSFGVLILEIFTGKRPTNELFEGNFTLISYTKAAMSEGILDIADEMILQNELKVSFPIVECLKTVLEVGLKCCEESPTNRLVTSEASEELISIREKFFKARRTTTY